MRSTLRSPELTSPLDLRVEALEDPKVEDGRSVERGEPGPPSEGRGPAAGSGDAGAAAEPVSWHARLLTWLGLQ